MGLDIKPDQLIPEPIKVSVSKKKARVWLYLVHSYELDPEGVYLTMTSSTMSLYTSEDMYDDELVVSVDYSRDSANGYPGAHLHVAGDRDDLDMVYLGDARKTRKLRDLHLPVGGKRFRPSLEDVIEFIVAEEMCVPRPDWQATLEGHRRQWQTIQLKAAVRRDPQAAADVLRESGWSVSAP